MTNQPTKIYLIDDHNLFLQGISRLLKDQPEFQIVGTSNSGKKALAELGDLLPDIILLDLRFPNESGLDVCRKIRERITNASIIILSQSDSPEDVFQALKVGAKGFLTKNTPLPELFSSITRIHRNGRDLEPIVAQQLIQEFDKYQETVKTQKISQPNIFITLSKRELQILKEVADGNPNKLIADNLNISEHTVRNHISNIFSKLEVNNRTEATVLALKQGIIPGSH